MDITELTEKITRINRWFFGLEDDKEQNNPPHPKEQD